MARRVPRIIYLVFVIFNLLYCEKSQVYNSDDDWDVYCDSLEAAGIIDDYTYPENISLPFNIHEDTLQQMCTHGLVQTCFNYPFLWHCTIYEHFTTFWYLVEKDFNGIPTLLDREDASEKVLDVYLDFNEYPYSDTILDFTTKKYIWAKLCFMELFLAHENIITTFSKRDKRLLGVKGIELWNTRNQYDTIDFSISPTYGCYLLGRLMYYDNYKPLIEAMDSNNDLASFIKTGSYIWYYNNAYETIMNSIEYYLQSLNDK